MASERPEQQAAREALIRGRAQERAMEMLGLLTEYMREPVGMEYARLWGRTFAIIEEIEAE